MFKTTNVLEKVYFLSLIIVFVFIVGSVHLIQGGIKINDNLIIEEEYIESFVIIILLFLGYILSRLHQVEIKKHKDKLEEAFKYIGQVNVQIQEINEIFSGIKEFPKSKKELKTILDFLTKKVLAIVSIDWVLVRIIDTNNQKTLREHAQARGNAVLLKYEIPNKMLLEGRVPDGYSIVTSEQNNLGLKAYFVLPLRNIKKEQKPLIKAIINQLEMIFVIFNSKFYRKQS